MLAGFPRQEGQGVKDPDGVGQRLAIWGRGGYRLVPAWLLVVQARLGGPDVHLQGSPQLVMVHGIVGHGDGGIEGRAEAHLKGCLGIRLAHCEAVDAQAGVGVVVHYVDVAEGGHKREVAIHIEVGPYGNRKAFQPFHIGVIVDHNLKGVAGFPGQEGEVASGKFVVHT